jgi:hypothetical protein
LTSGVEKEDHAPRERATTGQIARFRKIAVQARPAQVVGVILPSMLPGDDMFNVESVKRQVVFVEEAVFAPIPSAGMHECT